MTSIDEDLIELSDSLRLTLNLSDSRTLFAKSVFSELNKELPFRLLFADRASSFSFSDLEQKEMFIEVLQLTPLNDGKEYINCN